MGLLELTRYSIRRRLFAIGGAFDLYDDNRVVVGHCRQKAFKLKEDIRIYSDETKSKEILTIKASQIVDFSAAYDVVTPDDQITRGIWKRKGFSSIIRDTWKLETPQGEEMELLEDSTALAVFRRFGPLGQWIPQSYNLKHGDKVIAQFHQRFNPFIFTLDVELLDEEAKEHAAVIAAAAVLLCAIEGRQK